MFIYYYTTGHGCRNKLLQVEQGFVKSQDFQVIVHRTALEFNFQGKDF